MKIVRLYFLRKTIPVPAFFSQTYKKRITYHKNYESGYRNAVSFTAGNHPVLFAQEKNRKAKNPVEVTRKGKALRRHLAVVTQTNPESKFAENECSES